MSRIGFYQAEYNLENFGNGKATRNPIDFVSVKSNKNNSLEHFQFFMSYFFLKK
ncbi:MAG: hypothetical protein KDE57_04825 [Calditrichaeota bacterium]|nr:hypothetical protein [Calditrichota bacterium]